MRYLIVACCIAVAAPAVADVTLEYQDERGDGVVTIAVKGQMMRMDTHDGNQSGAVLFDASRDEITILQPRSREYIVLDQPTLERIQEQMRQAMQMMEQFGMDPEAMGLGGAKVDGRHVRTGESRTVGGHRCEVVRYEVDGVADTIACLAPHGELGVSDADWNTMRGSFEMMAKMAESMMPDGMVSLDMPPMDGVLIESHDADGGERQLLAQVDTAAIDADRFEIPAGWSRTSMDMPQMPGMPGGR